MTDEDRCASVTHGQTNDDDIDGKTKSEYLGFLFSEEQILYLQTEVASFYIPRWFK